MNTNSIIDTVIRCGEANGWDVRADRQGKNVIFEFYKFTPAGQDFGFSASMKGNSIDSLADDIEEYYEGFDPDYEASLWIGQDGHGRRGAPYPSRTSFLTWKKRKKWCAACWRQSGRLHERTKAEGTGHIHYGDGRISHASM